MKESSLQRTVMRKLKARLPAAVIWKLSDRFQRALPDILVIAPSPQGSLMPASILAIELKSTKGRLSMLQEFLGKRLSALAINVHYSVCRSWEEVEAMITKANL